MWKPESELLIDLVYKRVRVITTEKSEHIGWIFTVDPVSFTIVLVQFPENEVISPKNLRLIPGQSISDVKILDDRYSDQYRKAIDQILASDQGSITKEDEKSIADRKEKVKRWLAKNRIPIEETPESIRVFDAVEIRSPFDIDSCLCTNEVVLARVRKVLESMPSDF